MCHVTLCQYYGYYYNLKNAFAACRFVAFSVSLLKYLNLHHSRYSSYYDILAVSLATVMECAAHVLVGHLAHATHAGFI